jgi:hypothetical protein
VTAIHIYICLYVSTIHLVQSTQHRESTSLTCTVVRWVAYHFSRSSTIHPGECPKLLRCIPYSMMYTRYQKTAYEANVHFSCHSNNYVTNSWSWFLLWHISRPTPNVSLNFSPTARALPPCKDIEWIIEKPFEEY